MSHRYLIVGPSNCGKTFLLSELLNQADCDNIYLVSRSLHQPYYNILQRLHANNLPYIHNAHQIIKNNWQDDLDTIIDGLSYAIEQKPEILDNVKIPNLYTFDGVNEIPTLDDINPDENNVVIFDDIMPENQKRIMNYFTRGRHNNVTIFLAQSFFSIPKHQIRENADILIFFKLSLEDIRNIHRFYAGTNFCIEEFKHVCRECFLQPYNYLKIDRNDNSYTDRNGNIFTPKKPIF